MKTREFIINTPRESSQKFLIGNGTRAKMATVFAQLTINNQKKGKKDIIYYIKK